MEPSDLESYARDLREQIIRDYQTLELESNPAPSRMFYLERIVDYKQDLELLMTPQEELFALLFNSEKQLVKDMTTLELRAHREELSRVAYEARARLTAVDDEEQERRKKNKKDDGPQGFERSLNTDETATNAINAIKDRQKRLSKQEKLQQSLEKLGISSTDAAKLMSAGTILGRVKSKASEEVKAEQSESRPVFNPFEKKKESE